MRVYLPFTNLRCETYEACLKSVDNFAQLVLWPIRQKEHGYALFWQEVWRRGQTFINVEHDVVPRPGVLREMWDCPEPYCLTQYAYPFAGAPIHDSPIGCAKFSDKWIAEHQVLFLDGQHWHDPQYIILGASLNKFHLHTPPSLHLHVSADWPLDVKRIYGVDRLMLPELLSEPDVTAPHPGQGVT